MAHLSLRTVAALVLLGAAVPASAATIVVTSAADGVVPDGNCTLREAVRAANLNAGVDACAAGSPSGDVIVLTAIAGQTVALAGGAEGGQIEVTDGVTIGTALQDDVLPVTVVGDGVSRIFRVQVQGPAELVSFGGLVLRGGRGFIGGAVLVADNSETAFTDVTFDQNVSAASGGALRVGPGTHTLTACTFTANQTTAGGVTDGGGAVYNNGGVLTVNVGTFSGNLATMGSANGGALFNGFGAAATISNAFFTGNRAARAGGAIETAGALALVGGTYTENEAGVNGGAVHMTGAVTVTVSGSAQFEQNVAAGEGGALWNSSTGTLLVGAGGVLSANTALGGDADQGGGAIYSDGGTTTLSSVALLGNAATGASGSGGAILTKGPLTATNVFIVDNVAVRAGGGVEINAATEVVLSGTTLRGNDAGSNPGFGGGLHVTGAGAATVATSVFESNVANEGAGLWNSGAGTLTVRFSTVRTNASAGAGGGLYQSAGSAGVLRVENSLVEGNAAAGAGGGIGAAGAQVAVENTTLSGNTAARGAGLASTGGEIRVESATVAFNTASAQGGGVFNTGPADRAALANTIVSDNTAPEGPNLFGAVLSRGHNLFRTTAGATVTREASAGPDLTGVDPLLQPLADNGGPTLTHAVAMGSPAIGAGMTALPVDQRGFVRVTPMTIGAFEFGGIVATDGTPATEAFGLSAAAPNPFRGRTVLRASAADGEAVEVALYDALGRRIETLYAGAPGPGAEVTVDGRSLPPGVYVVRMVGATTRATRRLTIVR